MDTLEIQAATGVWPAHLADVADGHVPLLRDLTALARTQLAEMSDFLERVRSGSLAAADVAAVRHLFGSIPANSLTPEQVNILAADQFQQRAARLDHVASATIAPAEMELAKLVERTSIKPGTIDPAVAVEIRSTLLAIGEDAARSGRIFKAAESGDAVIVGAVLDAPSVVMERLLPIEMDRDRLADAWADATSPATARARRNLADAITAAKRTVRDVKRAMAELARLDPADVEAA